ncbi:hypothetical protein TYRP_010458 [Tyrophagus putrescentiae]|nr:hypothetical protein TYRP_010458 [Tyrophagus putrescentiae]
MVRRQSETAVLACYGLLLCEAPGVADRFEVANPSKVFFFVRPLLCNVLVLKDEDEDERQQMATTATTSLLATTGKLVSAAI